MTTLRSQLRLVLVVSGALVIPLLLPLVTGRLFLLNDLGEFHIPLRYLYREALGAGDSLLWTPAFYSGFYLFGEGQGGMAHPFHLLLYRLMSLKVGFTLEIASSYIVALTGAGLFLKRLGLSSEAAWFGALTFAFSGFNLLHLIHVNAIAVVAHIPWLLLATHTLLSSTDRGRRARAFAAIVLLFGSQILLGHPQMVWMTLLALGFLALCLTVTGTPRGRLAALSGALVLGVLIGGVQLLPTLDVLRESARAVTSAPFRLSLSLPPPDLVQLWSPYVFKSRIYALPGEQLTHELSVYNGAFCTVALAWLAVRWRFLRRRSLARALLVLAALGLVLALGRWGGVYTWLSLLPGVGAFRAPARHILLFHMALAGIAGLVFDDLLAIVREREKVPLRRFWPLACLALLSVITTLAAAAVADSPWAAAQGFRLSSLTHSAPWACLLIAVATLVTMAGQGFRWAVPAIVLLAAADLGVWGYFDLYRGPSGTIAAIAASAPVPPEARPGDSFEPARRGARAATGVMRGLRLSTGYLGLDPASVLDPKDPAALRIAGVVWRSSGTGWSRAADAMPRVRLLSVVQRSENIARDARVVDVSQVALVGDPIEGLAGVPGTARMTLDRPGRISVETTAPGRQLLVVTDRFHGGWRASEDGRECPTVRVYGDYLGCVVSPGSHHVTFAFAPTSARAGALLTVLGLVLTIFVSAALARRSGQTATTSSDRL